MTLNDLITLIISLSPFLIVKIFALLLLALYSSFAFIVIRQVDLMGKTVKVPLADFLKLLAVLHFLASLGLFFLAFLIL